MKNIIYPTIKKKFDKLTPVREKNDYLFNDDEGYTHLIYYGDGYGIEVSIEFFYLNYFGINVFEVNEDVGNIIIDLVKQSLGPNFDTTRSIDYKNVVFLSDEEFN
jgi:hypothetical protein